MKRFVNLWIFILATLYGFAQDCPTPLQWQPVTKNATIDWTKFPDFTLPFTIVYEGHRLGDTQQQPLKHGFSHLASYVGNEATTLAAAKRAAIWYGVATNTTATQPWGDKTLKSPWANDMAAYRQSWNQQLSNLGFVANTNQLNYDILALDIERVQDLDRDILTLKTNTRIPQVYRQMTDNQFVERYKRDMQKLYSQPVEYLKSRGVNSTMKIASYSDVMVRGSFNNWLALKASTWQDWTTNPSSTLHLMQDTLTGKVGGGFYNQLQMLTPSCYYYYAYDNALGKDYLAYLLFVVEANRHWSDKPIVPFVWLRYHDSFNPTMPFVPKFVAEATAIFPFFSGAKGLWLWDNPTLDTQQNYATYEYFIGGLYRLSLFKEFFVGNYELVIPEAAITSAATNKPIWRGVAKDNFILIAAQNPYANSDTETKEIIVNYKNWQKTITLKGREVFLCKFDLSAIASVAESVIQKFEIFPNPAKDFLAYKIELAQAETVNIELYNLLGNVLINKQITNKLKAHQGQLSLENLPDGLYFIKIKSLKTEVVHKVLVIRN